MKRTFPSRASGRACYRKYHIVRLILQIMLAALLGLPGGDSWAADIITVLTGPASPASEEFVSQLRNELAKAGSEKLAIRTVTLNEWDAAREQEAAVIIAVGLQATSVATAATPHGAVLGVLLPQASFEKVLADVKKSGAAGNLSAIYLDQPFSRQFNLIQTILPNASEVSALLGPAAQPQTAQLLKAAAQRNLGLLLEQVKDDQDLLPKLRRALEGSAALLAVPDPLVYNRDTAQTVLLTSYRYQKPVIGFSQAYVKAGALASVFSTPRQIAQQTAEIIRQSLDKQTRSPLLLPPPQYPKYFSVDINRQVARSLGIEVGDEASVMEMLSSAERLTP